MKHEDVAAIFEEADVTTCEEEHVEEAELVVTTNEEERGVSKGGAIDPPPPPVVYLPCPVVVQVVRGGCAGGTHGSAAVVEVAVRAR